MSASSASASSYVFFVQLGSCPGIEAVFRTREGAEEYVKKEKEFWMGMGAEEPPYFRIFGKELGD